MHEELNADSKSEPRVTESANIPAPLLRWLTTAVHADASDLHLVAGYPPVVRRHGRLRPLEEPALEDARLQPLLSSICPPSLLARFHQEQSVDFSLEASIDGHLRRFRVNCFLSTQEMGACLRLIPATIPDFEWSGFPRETAERLTHFRNGLVLITGVVGSGKSTTLAMIVNLLNAQGNCRIVTIEEPVEYRYPRHPDSVVTQREVGVDCRSFSDGLKYCLRQDPDVILVGEIRDRETAQMALTAAETGHLVLSTLHTRDARGAISRYADLFPQEVQGQIRAQLAFSLRAVVSQHLLPSADHDQQRQLALEILFNSSPIAAAIRSGKLQSIDNYILSGRDDGMRTLDMSISELYHALRITRETAERFISEPSSLY